jgi:hypothetical protein
MLSPPVRSSDFQTTFIMSSLRRVFTGWFSVLLFGWGGLSAQPLAPMPAWKLEYFTAAQLADGTSADEADPNRDGVPNLLAYSLGLPPYQPAVAFLPTAGTVANTLRLTFRRVSTATDIIYAPQASGNLLTWTEITATPVATQPLSAGLSAVTVADPNPLGAGTRRYLRLRVIRNNFDVAGDGLLDDWQLKFFATLDSTGTVRAPAADPDEDGLNNAQESALGTSPLDASDPLDNIAPSVPSGLGLTARTATTLSLSWSTASDNYALASYEIYQGTALLTTVAAPTTLITLSGLAPSTNYSLRVRARDRAGNTSAFGETLTAYTLGAGVPGTLSDLRLWLQAEAAPSSGPLGLWRDQSGNDFHAAQASASRQPLIVSGAMSNRPVVRFDGLDDSLNLPAVLAGASQGEIFIVNRLADFTNQYNGLCQFGLQNGVAYSETGSSANDIWDDFGINDANPFPGPGSVALTRTHVYNANITPLPTAVSTVRFDGRTLRVRVAQQVDFTATPLLGTDVYAEFFRGDIAEVIVYARSLSQAERDAVMVYLTNKYAPPSISVPATPVLAAHVVTGTVADLSWTTANGGNQYFWASLERKIEPAGVFQLIASQPEIFGYTDPTLTTGSTYAYRVKLTTYAGDTAYSNTVTLSPSVTLGAPPNAGMRLWLRSSRGLPSAGGVEAWLDQSGLGNQATQTIVENQPTVVTGAAFSGYPVVRFSGEPGQYMSLPDFMNGASAGEAFVVLSKNSAANEVAGLWTLGVSNGSRYPEVSEEIQDDFGTDLWTPANAGAVLPTLTVPHLYNVASGPGEWFQNLNGQRYATAERELNNVVFSSTPLLGAGINIGVFFPGDIAEVLVYSRVLTVAERAAVTAYLINKYNLP